MNSAPRASAHWSSFLKWVHYIFRCLICSVRAEIFGSTNGRLLPSPKKLWSSFLFVGNGHFLISSILAAMGVRIEIRSLEAIILTLLEVILGPSLNLLRLILIPLSLQMPNNLVMIFSGFPAELSCNMTCIS